MIDTREIIFPSENQVISKPAAYDESMSLIENALNWIIVIQLGFLLFLYRFEMR
jgi:hypothetical protein